MKNKRVLKVMIVVIGLMVTAHLLTQYGPDLMQAIINMHGG